MAKGVIVVGSFNVDHVWSVATLPRPGETLAGEYRSGPGGKGFNQAVAAARSGAAVRFACALGDDAGGQLARGLAAADGIELHALDSSAPTGTAGIYVDREGRNSIVIGPGANAMLSAAHVRGLGSCLAEAGVVLAQLESPAEAIREAFALARDHGAVTLLNPAPADAEVPPELWALTDLATPNETEFCTQLQRLRVAADPATVAGLADAELHALCRRLLPHGTVVVTLGAAGCFVSHAPGSLRGDRAACYRQPAPRVDAIDTIGAGDAFNGALAAALALAPGASFAGHAARAVHYAALSTERRGAAAAMPRAHELTGRFGDFSDNDRSPLPIP
ncbi:ribokinase [Marilutibacter chinensis]|uniref:Ribokinase n=1 Tax=Marilutibacter chinensis TaxID=2912247 RepID=A0ABS9HUM2_9GAMM|nr:ribokinase [Lysobacter chinensis]MCF7222565.1 ribokinase [Lysobacter chinensis]